MFSTMLKFVILPYYIYGSFKALQVGGMEDQMKHLKFWVVLAVMNWGETIFDVLWDSWYPYYGIKFIVFLWILAPESKGARTVYGTYVRTLLCYLQQKIDDCITKIKRQDLKLLLNMCKTGFGHLITLLKMGLTKMPILSTYIGGGPAFPYDTRRRNRAQRRRTTQ